MIQFVIFCLVSALISMSANGATLTVQTISETDAIITKANSDVGGGDLVPNAGGDVFLVLDNPGASTATVTITVQNATHNVPGKGPLIKASIVVTLLTTEEKTVGPFNSRVWNNSSAQLVLSYGGAGAADVDVAALKLDANLR